MNIPDEDRILRDGEYLRVPLMVMDAQQRAIGDQQPAAMTQAARRALQDAHDRRLAQRWKHPPAPLSATRDASPAAPVTGTVADRTPLYDAYNRNISTRWRGA